MLDKCSVLCYTTCTGYGTAPVLSHQNERPCNQRSVVPMATNVNSTTDLERHLISLRNDLQDASDAADRLGDCDAAWDIGLELLDARKAVNAALDALERATAPKVGPFFAPTVVRSAALDTIYATADELFA